ncbi:MAG: hypothetical protein J7K49_06340, partial [Thaumarchaeota archaeon]|nr:hypothetical protein [Nitrososphaerota archaeon]
ATRDGTIMELYVDGRLLAEEEIPSGLKVRDEVRFNYKLIFDEAGEHRIKAVVDSINWIIEKNEENNIDELTLTVVGLPDLTVEWVNIPSTAFAWEPTTISFKVKNIGEDVAHNFTVRFECMGEVVCSPPVETWGPLSLAPGEEKTFKLQVTFHSDGLYTVRIIADVEDNVKESNEENNFAEFMIQVFPPPLPDLAIQQAGYDITIKYVGEVATSHIKANMTIVNFGEDVDQSFTCRILLGGMVLGEEIVPGLKRGETYTITIERTVKGDVRGMTLQYIVDALDVIEEENEGNNIVTMIIKYG